MVTPPTAGHGSATGPTTASVVERTRAISVVLLAVVELLAAGTYLVESSVTGPGTTVAVALLVWAVVRVVTARPPRWWPVADTGVAAAFVLATPWLVEGPEFVRHASPMLAVGGTAVVAMGIACAPRRSLAATAVIMTCWAIGAARVPGVGNPLTIFNLDFLLAEWVIAASLRGLVLRAAGRTDAALAARSRARVDAEVAAARARGEREAWATMHDTAAATLSMLAQGVRVSTAVLRAQVRRDLVAVRDAGRIVAETTSEIDIAGIVAGLGDSAATPVRHSGPPVLVLPSPVGSAVVAAAREALSNADRHARAGTIRVELAEQRLIIADDGIGFDPDGPAVEARHGVRNSIRRRLTDAGADVGIVSSPGNGTRVEISWTGGPRPSPEPDTRDSAAGLLAGYRYGLVLVAALITALQGPLGLAAAHPGGQLAILVVAVGITAVAAWNAHTGVPRPLWWGTVITTLVIGPAQVALVDPADLATGANWAVSGLAWQLVALSSNRPTRVGMTVLATMWTAGLAVVVLRATDIASVVPLLYTVISVSTIQALALGFNGMLFRIVRRSRRLSAETTEIRLEIAIGAAVHQDSLARYRTLSEGLVPLLNRLLAVEDPADPALRVECLIESTRLRRMFEPRPPGANPLIDELAAAIASAERRGVAVTRHVLGDVPELAPEVRRNVLTIAVVLLEHARSHARVVVTALGRPERPATLSVTVDRATPEPPVVADPAGIATLVVDDELIWATVLLA